MTESIHSSTDIVWQGIPAIAAATGMKKRRALYLHEIGELPTFKIGKIVCMRPEAWRSYIARLESERAA